MVHGHRFAMFKCDSCCSHATWSCTWHHYCERCHEEAGEDKHYPCPGAHLCPLGMPHPRNVEANHDLAECADEYHRPFVIGCTACFGADEEQSEVDLQEQFQFGYQERDWGSFANGEEVLKALGDAEIRDHLRAHVPRLKHKGSSEECSERLLLHKQQVTCPHNLLKAEGGAAALLQRLTFVGFRPKKPLQPLQCAQLLLQLREKSVRSLQALPSQKERLRRQSKAMKYFMNRH